MNNAFERVALRRLGDLLEPDDQAALRGLLGADTTKYSESWQPWSGTLEHAVRLHHLELIALRLPWTVPQVRLTRLGWLVARSEELRPSFWAAYLR